MRLQANLSLQLDMADDHLQDRFGTTDPDEIIRKVQAEGDEAMKEWIGETRTGRGEITAATLVVTRLYG